MRILLTTWLIVLLPGIIFSSHQVTAQPVEIVSPLSYENVEGDSLVVNASTNGRFQNVYPASDFASLLSHQQTIISMAWRPDGALEGPLEIMHENFTLRLSTTNLSPPNLSLNYADNIGTDSTIVFDGPLDWSTDNVGPAGGPKEFDYLLEFQNPFQYDPTQGNLLIDLIWSGASATQSYDFIAQPGAESHMVTGVDPTAQVADFEWGGIMARFSFIPEPSTLLLMLLGLLAVGISSRYRR